MLSSINKHKMDVYLSILRIDILDIILFEGYKKSASYTAILWVKLKTNNKKTYKKGCIDCVQYVESLIRSFAWLRDN